MYDLNDEVYVMSKDIHSVVSKDIALMNKEATFSAPLVPGEDYYLFTPTLHVETIELLKKEEVGKEEAKHIKELTLFE